jgi:hypothetical protein
VYNGTENKLFLKKPMIQLVEKYYIIFSLSVEYPRN